MTSSAKPVGMRAAKAIAGLAIAGVLLSPVAGCAGGHSGGEASSRRTGASRAPSSARAVAQVGPYRITEAALDREARALTAGPSDPRRLGAAACAARARSSISSSAPGAAESRGECEIELATIRRRALVALIAQYWQIGAARELGLRRAGLDAAEGSLERRARLASRDVEETIAARAGSLSRQQVVRYYAQHRDLFSTAPLREVRIVRALTRSSAEAVRRRLEAGARFPQLWRQMRQRGVQQAALSENGVVKGLPLGRYGTEPNLERAIWSAPVGALRGPISTVYRYFVFEVAGVKPRRYKPLAEVEGRLRRELRERKQRLALRAYAERWRAAWTARTTCRGDHVVPGCRGYEGGAAVEEGPQL